MLTTPERIAFLLAALLTLYLAFRAARRLYRVIGRGSGRVDLGLLQRRAVSVLFKTISFAPVFRARLITSLMHGLVGWGFIFYLLVNIGDVLQGYIPDFVFLGTDFPGNVYRLLADIFSVAVVLGMGMLLFRRFALRPRSLGVRKTTLLHPKAKKGISRDSVVVGVFIILHVGSRFLGESFHLASVSADPWQPFASAVAGLWQGFSPRGLIIARHICWWMALGLILAFIPYFPYSKHAHLFMAPLNFLLRPARRSIGELSPLDFEDQSIEEFGAERLEHLPWSALMDAYACIMCNRCQEACPAYETGKVLSPAALEINKRYFLNQEGSAIAEGASSEERLVDFAIPRAAVWACTACGACVDICPVANEPMQDIMEMRRHMVLMENNFPPTLQAAYRSMERTGNPWGIPPDQRLAWAEGLKVPTAEENPGFELLWWVGCAPATDPRAQASARAFAKILNLAEISFAVLGSRERCTGDSARRSGNEYLFYELAMENVKTLNDLHPKRIVTTCPHCFHTLKNEYPAFGGMFEVIHHTQLIEEVLASGDLALDGRQMEMAPTFHDPCYLGRNNAVYAAPRAALRALGASGRELPRSRAKSFCCGAGGAQMWKEEEEGAERVSENRLREALETGADTLAVACPFCMLMLADAAASQEAAIQVRDVVEIVADHVEVKAGEP